MAAVAVGGGVTVTSPPSAKKEDPLQPLCLCLSRETRKQPALATKGRKHGPHLHTRAGQPSAIKKLGLKDQS